mmetsp:Transcript_45093/g.88233  ORF Transcript_45093/g.88233 Transcript_45093/m.88233 type:complete len:469 (-) Transcript_45093:172-1578(-)
MAFSTVLKATSRRATKNRSVLIVSSILLILCVYNMCQSMVWTLKETPDAEFSVIPGEEISNNSKGSLFEPWINDYISFHNSAIEDGRLKDGYRYVIYKCSESERCGGVGDRVLSMIRAFYFAMRTGRVLLIDSKFPVELKNYLNPNFMRWDAEHPFTNEIIDDMNAEIPIGRREDTLGYVLGRCNGNGRHSLRELSTILHEPYMRGLFQKNGQPPENEFLIPKAFHQAFWALFKFDENVLLQTEKMKQDAGLATSPNSVFTRFQTFTKKPMMPYIGLHNRHGDSSIKGVNSTWVSRQSRETKSSDLVNCYQTFRSQFPDRYQAAYLASDDYNVKKSMHKEDSTILYPPKIKIFHVDLSTRADTGRSGLDNKEIDQGVLDTWAEVAVLVDSDCLILSSSLFSFLAYYIRGDTTCNVYLPECNTTTVAKRINKYTEDPLTIIYPTVFPPNGNITHNRFNKLRRTKPASWH